MDETTFTRAKEFAASIFKDDSSGHDIYHTMRVHDLAVTISEAEGGDLDIIRLAAILHDVDDRKLFGENGFQNARDFMDSEGISVEDQLYICDIIEQISFKGKDSAVPSTLEGKIVQDADRMDAIGAVGIARAFAYGGSRGRAMHIPGDAFKAGMGAEEYFRNEGTSVNHFYEKLLLLKDMMNTSTARKMAEARHGYMVAFLDEFMAEWDGLR